MHDESYLHRGQITRADVPKLLPHPDLYGASIEVRKEVARLARQGLVIRYDDYTFPVVKRGYAFTKPGISPEAQAIQESLRSLRAGVWVHRAQGIADIEARLEGELAALAKPPAMSVIEYDRQYSLEELREKAKQVGLSASGSKKEIAAKLIAKGVT